MNNYFFCCNLYLQNFVVIFDTSGCICLLLNMFSISAQSCQIAPYVIRFSISILKIHYVLHAVRKKSVSVIDKH